jgi:hypothetical protein
MKTALVTVLSLGLLAALPAFAAPGAPATCPLVMEQLPELLASAKQRAGNDGAVRVEFEVDANGRAWPIAVAGSRHYRSAVRTAIESLDCHAGTPQRYVLNIRFAEPEPALAARAASATVAQATDR